MNIKILNKYNKYIKIGQLSFISFYYYLYNILEWKLLSDNSYLNVWW